MSFDFKKEYKEFYLPSKKPGIVTVPAMNYIAVRGKGNPNDENGEYKTGIGLLYGIAFTIKMSYKGNHKMDGYFQYVVPPLEGFWWQAGTSGIDYYHKEDFNFISVIRLPDFVTKKEFDWAIEEATKRKSLISQKLSFLLMTKEYACSVCILVLLMTSHKRLLLCMGMPGFKGMKLISQIPVTIMKFICLIQDDVK